MQMLSEDDVNLGGLSAEELDAAWDLWFDLAQTTNDSDPMYSHGVFVNAVTDVSGERSVDDGAHGPSVKMLYGEYIGWGHVTSLKFLNDWSASKFLPSV